MGRDSSILQPKSMPSIGIAVITHNAVKHLPHCLAPLLNSRLKPRILVVNSSSADGTVELAQKLGAQTLVIPRCQFNHGLTRERARRVLGTDIVVMCTPDAYATSAQVLEKLIAPLAQENIAIAYARQVPHNPENVFEAFPRLFNYPPASHVRGIEDLPVYGVYTYFNSDSFAAYKNSCLDEIGGFSEVLLGEDTLACAKLLERGYKIAYVAEAIVKHSHAYTLVQEFQRSFDIGLARKTEKKWLKKAGRDEARGISYTRDFYRHILRQEPGKLPLAIAHTAAKYAGYRLGRLGYYFPVNWKKFFSGQDYYWMES